MHFIFPWGGPRRTFPPLGGQRRTLFSPVWPTTHYISLSKGQPTTHFIFPWGSQRRTLFSLGAVLNALYFPPGAAHDALDFLVGRPMTHFTGDCMHLGLFILDYKIFRVNNEIYDDRDLWQIK